MNFLAELRARFAAALTRFAGEQTPLSAAELAELVAMVRPSQEAKFGDYQANFAMPLGKRLGKPPRDIATAIVELVEIDDLCETPELAGPGFINLRLRQESLTRAVEQAAADQERLAVPLAQQPRTVVLDFSAPNVAKPMHVGHIRSTVIGDSLYRTLKFLGHRVIADNHIGDWGTQFGMIIFGYVHFRDDAAYQASPVNELSRLYRLVHRLVDYHDSRAGLPEQVRRLKDLQDMHLEQSAIAERATDPAEQKKLAKAVKKLAGNVADARNAVTDTQTKLAAIESDPVLSPLAQEYPTIASDVLAETAKLHAGDAENLRLWREFMGPCLAAIEDVYQRLNVSFDVALGESFYHDRLAGVVEDLQKRGLARVSEGATCVFLEGDNAPMIVRKQDGAFLYATTDLATIQYRMQTWQPDSILYVVDHRQSQHFQQLFATARLWGCENVEFQHISFGTVLGDDGRPFKTRSGDTVGLLGLLDEAVSRAEQIVATNDDALSEPQLSAAERSRIGTIVGLGAVKYADLAHNRTSDYTFSYDKMLAMNGNTATYMQYAYARVRSIFRRGNVDLTTLYQPGTAVLLESPAERALAVALLRFAEALDTTLADYRPNQLTTYLFELANCYSTFFEQCPVLKAAEPATRTSRLILCDLTARTLKQGLALLGIDVVEKM